MKALVTGGGGFLGGYIVNKLLQRGDSVRVLGRGVYPELREKGVEIVSVDIANKDAVIAACTSMDIVYHTAAKAGIWGNWDDFNNTNVIGTKNVIEGCLKNKIRKLVYTSSPSVIYNGEDQLNIDESVPYPKDYLCTYQETKAEAEQAVIAANGKEGLFTVSLRPHLIWGPGDTQLIPRLIERARNKKIKMVGEGKNLIDTVYVENAADAHILAGEKLEENSPVAGSVYFITNGEPVNCWAWIGELLKGFNLPPITRMVPYNAAFKAGSMLEWVYGTLMIKSEPRMTRFLASQLAKSHTYSIEKARKELGYEPKVKMADGMKLLFNSQKAN